MPVSLEIGEVVGTRWDSRPCRVLAFDAIEVFYDSWWPEIDQWTFGVRRRRATYYRMPTDLFLDSLIRLRKEPMGVQEASLHRPDLPLRAYRDRRFSWGRARYPNRESFAKALGDAGMDIARLPTLATDRIVLVRRTPRGALKKGPIVSTDDGGSLSALDVLWNAQKLQALHQASDPAAGIGIYRLGLESRGLPSYVVGEYHDPYGATERFEGRA